MRFLSACAIAFLALQSAAVVVVDRKLGGFTVIEHPDPAKRDLLQDIVKWDNESLFINGERIMIFSAEFHPFRLPVPSLWLDIFQNIKALGFNCVSFYTNWALTGGKPGEYTAEGIFAWEPFFEAATEAGIYLLLDLAHASTQKCLVGVFLAGYNAYIAHIASPVAKAQITNGGPVILYQPENEHTLSLRIHDFPDGDYMQYVIDQARKAGIVVPMISNDAWAAGNNAPGTGKGEVDIYGHDKYPPIPTSSLLDFCPPIGGSSTSSKVPSHLTPLSRAIQEATHHTTTGLLYLKDRNITREKYGELRLIGNFMKASPSFMNAVPGHWSISKFTTTPTLTVTSLIGRLSDSSFFVLRHSEYSSKASTNYKLKLPTSVGRLIMPQLNGTLTLNGRDSKIYVTDYDVAGTKYFLLDCRDIHMEEVWGPQGLLVEGPSHDMTIKKVDDYVVLNWETMRERRIVDIGDLSVFILVRTAFVRGSELHITADFNTTTPIEIIGAPKNTSTLHINGEKVVHKTTSIEYVALKIDLPDLESLEWKYIDSLPELQEDYDDSLWTVADHKKTNNTLRPLTTPTSLHASDYGYHTGYLVYRGHFVASGIETGISFETQGGFGFGNSAWLNGSHIGSWKGKSYLGSKQHQHIFLPQTESR
ncbi:uncharacterized protein BDCG_16244 [Blastomyces dermatitidis ER-3]|uniref:beta-galactosidase n=1 Tax=Ajellomyces dermatitidis (strain ER-3 / ATCC MYA-2586) TaxID=559297 RepID=A0ABX2VST4_AJEDR|nr:uncharacterized protein BDCG_16244 [Blastomyces dermatitidis ER-3]OAS99657.1 hypothetical protein BDCG_16244 [Blastomyces dermatitidis ER-3]